MSSIATQLLSQIEALDAPDRQEFAAEFLRRLPVWDSGDLSDEVAAAASDDLAAMLEEEEQGESPSR